MTAHFVASDQVLDYAREALLPLVAILQAEFELSETDEWLEPDRRSTVPDGPMRAFAALRASRAGLDGLEFAAVNQARQQGVSWRAIGHGLGISRQAAQKRWSWIELADPGLRDRARG